MKILMLLDHEFPPDIRVENEIEMLIEAGYEVHLACYTMQDRKRVDSYRGLTIFRKQISKFIYKSSVGCLKFPFYFNFWRKFMNEIFKGESYDAVHVNDLPLAQIGYELKEKYGCKLVLDLHENWAALLGISTHTQTVLGRLLSSDRQWRVYEKMAIRTHADKVIVVCQEAKARLMDLTVSESKITVVENNVNKNQFKVVGKLPADPEFMTIFYAGGLNKHRGVQNVIEAMSILKDPCIRFWIVGKGSYSKTLERLSETLKTTSSVKFWGWQPLGNVARLLMSSDIGIIPHLKSEHTDASMPHKLSQYMYAGKPVIVSNCDSLVNIIKETKCGFVYEDVQELVDVINHYSVSRRKRIEHGENGRKWVDKKYNWKQSNKPLIKLYDGLI